MFTTPPCPHSQEYDFYNRGLRVITGRNVDDSGTQSNGAGKTSLIAAPLWALTGDMLARTESGGASRQMLVDSMLNERSKQVGVFCVGHCGGHAW